MGPENVVMATDGGATENPPVIEQFKRFIRDMLDAGINEDDILIVIRDNPHRIINLD